MLKKALPGVRYLIRSILALVLGFWHLRAGSMAFSCNGLVIWLTTGNFTFIALFLVHLYPATKPAESSMLECTRITLYL